MSLISRLSIGMVLAGGALFAQPTVTCSSNDMRLHYCGVDTRGGVTMIRQRSDASCIQGRTWGYDRGGIWVDRGCRADFALGAYGYERGPYGGGPYERGPFGGGPYSAGPYGSGPYDRGAYATMSCSSDDMRRHYCGADTRGGVTMIRQRSDASCIEGRTWGYDRRGIWVDRGCRADFALGTGNYGWRRERGWFDRD